MVDALALPPPFEYLPSLFPADEEHARLRAFVRRHHARLGGGPLELGEEGRTAAESVAFLRSQGATRVLVVDAHSDPAGARVLLAELALQGIGGIPTSTWAAWSSLPGAALAPQIGDERSWARRYGLDRAEGRAALRARVAREDPALAGWVEAVLDFQALGLHPLAELYAGNGLAERNAEYLVNLAP